MARSGLHFLACWFLLDHYHSKRGLMREDCANDLLALRAADEGPRGVYARGIELGGTEWLT